MRGYNNPAQGPQPQFYGTSLGQPMPQYGQQHRNNSNSYVNKPHQAHNSGQGNQAGGSSRGQGRTPDAPEDAK
jgi:hypothetical protein